jgi:subtilisin family serine protease
MIRALVLALITGLAACTSARVHIESRVLAEEVSQTPEHFIIAAVSNDPAAFMSHAASTPRGYDMVSAYGPTEKARQMMRKVEADYSLREVGAWPIESLHMHCAVLEIPAGADRDALLARLAQDRRIALTQAVQVFAMRTEAYGRGGTVDEGAAAAAGAAASASTAASATAAGGGAYNDPYVGLQRGFQEMDVAGAQSLSRGEGVRVAVIDTGVDVNHPDLRGSIAGAANFVDADDKQFVRDRHGTEMAGVIAAVANNREGIVGVSPRARLLVYKACWQAEEGADAAHCNSFTLARALSAAYDAHAQVINMSLAGPDDPLVGDLIRVGLRRGALIVGAAAADSGAGGLLHQRGIIEVASADAPGTVGTPLFAPGKEILTLLPGGHYDFASGASIATAQVSGIVALMLAKDPSLSAETAYKVLRSTSSVKQVNACAALLSLLHRGECRTGGEGGTLPHDARLAAH